MRSHICPSPNRRRRLGTRALAVAMALVAIQQIRPAHADPADIFAIGAPVIGAEAPKAEPLADGDASVSTQTGSLQYTYPIDVPPGRHGMQPHLGLHYASQGPIYGTLAAGWTLDIPIITEDTTLGRLWSVHLVNPPKNYQSSMAGNRPLIAVTEATPAGTTSYRAQSDSSFTRYQLSASATGDTPWWRALGTDGTVYQFGQTSHAGGCKLFSDEYAPLTQTSDAFGNQVDYYYTQGTDGDCPIASITWGENSSGQLPFASIAFGYSTNQRTCAGIHPGAQTSHRTGRSIVTGASQLHTITIDAFPPGQLGTSSPDHERVLTLLYDEFTADGQASVACFRQLALRRDHRIHRLERRRRRRRAPPSPQRQVLRRGQRPRLLRRPLLRQDVDELDPGRSDKSISPRASGTIGPDGGALWILRQ